MSEYYNFHFYNVDRSQNTYPQREMLWQSLMLTLEIVHLIAPHLSSVWHSACDSKKVLLRRMFLVILSWFSHIQFWSVLFTEIMAHCPPFLSYHFLQNIVLHKSSPLKQTIYVDSLAVQHVLHIANPLLSSLANV